MKKEWTALSLRACAERLLRVDREWMLIGAADGERGNLMTASWGGVGYAWGRTVALCLIRPSRFTHGLVERTGRLSLSFLPKGCGEALQTCGRLSGREGDKFARAGLHCAWREGVPFPEEAETVLLCRVLYRDPLCAEGFVDPQLLPRFYPEGDLHQLLLCAIEEGICAAPVWADAQD